MVLLSMRWPQQLTDTLVLEKEPGGKFSDPTVIRTCDALIRIMYTWKRAQHTRCPASGKALTG
jgi:hypothetical protein